MVLALSELTNMSQSIPNRIPAEKLDYCRDWPLPEFGENASVVASAEKEARDQRGGREYVEEVESESEDLQPLTADMLEEITKAAEQDGYQSGFTKGEKHGYEAGYNAGLKAAEEQIQGEMARVSQISEALVEPLEQQEEALETIILDMVTALTRTIIKRELQLDSGDMVRLVNDAIAALPQGRDQVKLYVNPDDLAVLETYAEAQQKPWKFMADTDLIPGGVRIETQESLVDFSVESRMQTVFEQFAQRQYATQDADEQPDENPEHRGSND